MGHLGLRISMVFFRSSMVFIRIKWSVLGQSNTFPQENGVELQSSLEQKGKENTWLLKASESLGPQNLAPHVGYLRVSKGSSWVFDLWVPIQKPALLATWLVALNRPAHKLNRRPKTPKNKAVPAMQSYHVYRLVLYGHACIGLSKYGYQPPGLEWLVWTSSICRCIPCQCEGIERQTVVIAQDIA